MNCMDLSSQLVPNLRKGDLDYCANRIAKEIKMQPVSPFHIVLKLNFYNPIKDIAIHFEKFIKITSKKINIKAIYTETNGFDINPDCWYFDVFGYEEYGGHEDYDWLSDWKSDDFQQMILTGMEKLQEIYASDAFNNEDYSEVIGLTSLLVVIKYQQLIKKSGPLITNLNVPLLATSHDYDFIYEYNK